MKLTETDMKWLSQFETNMGTAVRSNWASPISDTNLAKMSEIFNRVYGTERRVKMSCASCVLELLTDMGRLYFAQKEAQEAPKKTRVGCRSTKVANIQGVAVKTRNIKK